MDVGSLTHSIFESHVGEIFCVDRGADGGTVELELSEVDVRATPSVVEGESAARQPFSLLFRGSPDDPLIQGTVRIEHESLGAADLLIVPVGPESGMMRYEIVFG